MQGRLLLICLAASGFLPCTTVAESSENADAALDEKSTIECFGCERFNPIWQEQERITCVHDKQGVWDFNDMTCSVE